VGEWTEFEQSRARYCDFLQSSLRIIFQHMLGVMDENPKLWDEVVRFINQRVEREKREREERLAPPGFYNEPPRAAEVVRMFDPNPSAP